MIRIDSKFRSTYRALVKKSRREPMSCIKLRNGLYFVRRTTEGHGEYLVFVEMTKTGLFGTCRRTTGGPCKSYGCCTHLAKAVEAMIAEGLRIQRRERAA